MCVCVRMFLSNCVAAPCAWHNMGGQCRVASAGCCAPAAHSLTDWLVERIASVGCLRRRWLVEWIVQAIVVVFAAFTDSPYLYISVRVCVCFNVDQSALVCYTNKYVPTAVCICYSSNKSNHNNNPYNLGNIRTS